MNVRNLQLVATMFVCVCEPLTLWAEKAPRSSEALRSEADAIVVATIEKIRIESESSTLEPGFGNSDWGIYLTLSVDSVEKGTITDEALEARCFRVRKRRSARECLTPSGHHPIPENGTRVRVYLQKSDGSWHIVLPNGIAADDVGQPSGEALSDAKEITQLRSLSYTFVLPLEAWLLLGFVCLPALMFFGWHRKRHRAKTLASETNAAGRNATDDG